MVKSMMIIRAHQRICKEIIMSKAYKHMLIGYCIIVFGSILLLAGLNVAATISMLIGLGVITFELMFDKGE